VKLHSNCSRGWLKFCARGWMKFPSFGWNLFFPGENKYEAITTSVLHQGWCYVSVWMKLQSFGWNLFSLEENKCGASQQLYGSQGCYVSMYGWNFNHLDELIFPGGKTSLKQSQQL
jgi:hypothetical protein